jgi:DNA-directed RNA polymerase subunit RPC12/RpoP
MSKYTFKQFQAEYPDDGACLDKIMVQQFGGTEFQCGSCRKESKFHRIAKRRAYACQHCGFHIYPCVGTIFEKSRTPLTNWFFAMYLMTSTRHGVAAKEVERQIGCTYKTAWRMCHELRKLMDAADHKGPLSGHVEVDETFMGGRQSIQDRKEQGTNKVAVMGLVERGGNILAGPVPATTMQVLEPLVRFHVARGSVVSTDEARAYADLKKAGYDHGAVTHSAKEYVRGIHHTNTLESHWSLLNRSIRGTHVHVSSKHLWKYVAEFSYRRNRRADHRDMFNRLVTAFWMPRLQDA